MRDLEADLGIPKTTVSKVLTQDLGTKHVVAKFVPWLLPPETTEHHTAVINDLIQTATNEPRISFFDEGGKDSGTLPYTVL